MTPCDGERCLGFALNSSFGIISSPRLARDFSGSPLERHEYIWLLLAWMLTCSWRTGDIRVCGNLNRLGVHYSVKRDHYPPDFFKDNFLAFFFSFIIFCEWNYCKAGLPLNCDMLRINRVMEEQIYPWPSTSLYDYHPKALLSSLFFVSFFFANLSHSFLPTTLLNIKNQMFTAELMSTFRVHARVKRYRYLQSCQTSTKAYYWREILAGNWASSLWGTVIEESGLETSLGHVRSGGHIRLRQVKDCQVRGTH